jgi:NADH-quinone oxidoreductase subunit L
MLARCSPLYELAPTAMMEVTYVGAITAIFAASVGLVQNDIKRVIAYSTCSQLGYMFFACGVSAYNAAIFHLLTHGFFKALLFLGAGSVIHAMSGEQDLRKMGGIWKKIPYTYACMWIGSLALAGIPFFAGYFSKDAILEAAYAVGTQQGEIAFYLGIAAAFMTAFYSWRLLFMAFHGKPRADHHTMSHIHESPPIMLLPLVPLVLGAIFAGAIGYYGLGMMDHALGFWNGSISILPEHQPEHHKAVWYIHYAPLIAGVSGISLAWLFYIVNPTLPIILKNLFIGAYRFLLNKWYFDELYDRLFVRNSLAAGRFLWRFFDVKIIDGLGPNGFAFVSRAVALRTARAQTGYLYHYAFAMLIGLLVLISWLVYSVVM